ncbi:MAG: dNTP triphosphohydrolase [Bacteroidales bacterium]|nr:dNTP triphosphohydrolase [Candidatus Physcousia equi]
MENLPPRPDDRTEFQRDYDRLIFSAPFRRMQNKTQVFPLPGSIFVHNRLTHSLEVSSVGRSLGNDVSRMLLFKHPWLYNTHLSELGSIVSAACLAHDMGNPPFGHSGEKAIATFFSEGRGQWLKDYRCEETGDSITAQQWEDLIHFEGNANAFRLLTHHFKGRRKGGFMMTYSTLASIVKYPFTSDLAGSKAKFGFFREDMQNFQLIADQLGIAKKAAPDGTIHYCRYPLVYLVEAADDICYEIMDIEDAYKLKILTEEETKTALLAFFEGEKRQQIVDRMNAVGDLNEQIVFLRSVAINCLEGECVRVFVENEESILAGTFEGTLIGHISEVPRRAYQECVRLSFKKIYRSKNVIDIEVAGFKVITELLDLMTQAVTHSDKAYSQLLINRVSTQYDILAPTLYGRIMAVIDYVSGMTDVFALDLYHKINGMMLPNV